MGDRKTIQPHGAVQRRVGVESQQTKTRVQMGEGAEPRAVEGTQVGTDKVFGKSIWERTVGEWLSEAGIFFSTMLQSSLELGVDFGLFINFFVLNNRIATIERLLLQNDPELAPKLETYVGYLLNDVGSRVNLPVHVLKLLTNEKIFSHTNQTLRGRVYKTLAANSNIDSETVDKLLKGLGDLKEKDQMSVLRELAKEQKDAETQKQVAVKIIRLLANQKSSSMKSKAYDGLAYIASNKSITASYLKTFILIQIIGDLGSEGEVPESVFFALGKFAEDKKFFETGSETFVRLIVKNVINKLFVMEKKLEGKSLTNAYGVFALCVKNDWIEELDTNIVNKLLEDLPKLTKDGQKYAYAALKLLVEKKLVSQDDQKSIANKLLESLPNLTIDAQPLARSVLSALQKSPTIGTDISAKIADALRPKKKQT